MNPFNKNRKIYLINPRFQYSFIIFSSTVGFLTLCILYFAILYFFWSFEHRGIKLGIPSDHIFFRFIDEERNTMNLVFVVAAIIGLVVTSVGALILSHKVAGPLGRLEEHMEKITSKELLSPVKFRTGDFFIEIEEAFNKFINNVGNEHSKEAKSEDIVE